MQQSPESYRANTFDQNRTAGVSRSTFYSSGLVSFVIPLGKKQKNHLKRCNDVDLTTSLQQLNIKKELSTEKYSTPVPKYIERGVPIFTW